LSEKDFIERIVKLNKEIKKARNEKKRLKAKRKHLRESKYD